MLCHGVTRKGRRGIPPSVLQEYLMINKGQLESLWMTKEAVMQGGPKFPNLVAKSVYDTKHVYYLNMVSSDLKWIVTEKYVFKWIRE